MSGQLVGEVLDAAEAGLLDGLSPPAFHALLAIAERCHQTTRQGWVPRSRIQAAIWGHNSPRTASRAVCELRDAGLIVVVKRGYQAPGSQPMASVYELTKLTPPKVARASAQADAKIGEKPGRKPGQAHAKTGQAHATQGGATNGIYNGNTQRENPPYPPEPETVSPQSVAKGWGKQPTPAELDQIDGYRLAEAFSASLPTPLETGVLNDVGVEVNKCLDSGIPPDAIAAGLQAWTRSDSFAPSQIPRFVHKANNGQPVATSDLRVQQGQALKHKYANRSEPPE